MARITDYIKDRRILSLIIVVLLLFALDIFYGTGPPYYLHFGIEFTNGTQIPVTLGQPVDPSTMSRIISILQQRVSTYGLKQVTVEGIGNSNIYIIIPSISGKEINATINIIQSQGIFEGIVNGVEALNGSSILSGSIGAVPPTTFNGNVSWAVNFFITQSAAEKFAKVVFGQANKPLYMFLDRPTSSIVLINATLLSNTSLQLGFQQALSALQSAASFGSKSIPIEVYEPSGSNWNSLYSFFAAHNSSYRNVILAKNTPRFMVQNLTRLNYTIVYVSVQNMTPEFEPVYNPASPTSTSYIVNSWPAIGLLSAPLLSPGVTNGSISQSYQISGYAPPSLPLESKLSYAQQQSQMIASILSGGALPVHIIVGTPKVMPPTLGKHFLYISAIAAVLAVAVVTLIIVIRYRRAFLILPIMLTTFVELFIIVSVIGLIGTIDLAAVAGMIAVVGTGVDAQIIITDELITGKSEAMKFKLGNAFYIVWADAILLIIAMLPLLFSTSLVDIVGFAESTILGALLGVLVTRPAYGAIVSIHYGEKGEEERKEEKKKEAA
jgi:preprotein translocase subunit SecD